MSGKPCAALAQAYQVPPTSEFGLIENRSVGLKESSHGLAQKQSGTTLGWCLTGRFKAFGVSTH
jgi:hypothetical protein